VELNGHAFAQKRRRKAPPMSLLAGLAQRFEIMAIPTLSSSHQVGLIW
jgi:hypothetical protein